MISSAPRDYSLIAPVYDQIFHKLLSEGHREIGLYLKERSKDKKLKVLEVGIGSGLTLNYLPKKIAYTGIDINQRMLNLAKEKTQRINLMEASLSVMDAKQLQFKSGTFDVVIAASVVTAVDDPQKTIEEMIRVTKKSGFIAIVANIRKNNSLKSGFLKSLDPFTKMFFGFRMDLEEDFFDRFRQIELTDHRPINFIAGRPLSSFLVFRKKYKNWPPQK
jgi:phosphatidylethanolamine/phosphatidyl-N-methylethanolamine N-methyltransferase